jgi:hypothetical protein
MGGIMPLLEMGRQVHARSLNPEEQRCNLNKKILAFTVIDDFSYSGY